MVVDKLTDEGVRRRMQAEEQTEFLHHADHLPLPGPSHHFFGPLLLPATLTLLFPTLFHCQAFARAAPFTRNIVSPSCINSSSFFKSHLHRKGFPDKSSSPHLLSLSRLPGTLWCCLELASSLLVVSDRNPVQSG